MTQPAEPETVDLAIVSCETCDQLFLLSPRRQTCGNCGGGPGLTFFEFVGNSAGLVLKGMPELAAALHPPTSPAPPGAQPAPSDERGMPAPVGAAGPPETRSPEEEEREEAEEAEEETEARGRRDMLAANLAAYLLGVEGALRDIIDECMMLGATPDDTATAVGRLAAVRDLITSLFPVDTAAPTPDAPTSSGASSGGAPAPEAGLGAPPEPASAPPAEEVPE